MRILITGAHGQLGTELQRVLHGHETVPVDLPGFDLTQSSCRQHIVDARPDVVIHAGAYTDVDGAERDPDRAMRINADGTGYVAQASQDVGARLIYISTDYVFDGSKTSPYLEQDEPKPVNAYGRSKRNGEQRALSTCASTLVLRTAWLYGAHGKNFVKTIVQMASERPVLKVVADQHGCPTSTQDLAQVIAVLLLRPLSGILHVTNEGSCSWFEFAREIIAVSGHHVRVEPITTDEAGRQARRPAHSILSLDRLHQLGLQTPTWREALRTFLTSMPSATAHRAVEVPIP